MLANLMKMIGKKLLLLLLFIPLVSIGQDNNAKINIKSNKNEYTTELGLKYIGNGVYQYAVKGGSTGTTKLMEKRALKGIEVFVNNQNRNYEIITSERSKIGVFSYPYAKVTFKLLNKDGSLVLNKEDAKNKLIELKEYLDLGIITQEEFNTKAVSLKKILLGN